MITNFERMKIKRCVVSKLFRIFEEIEETLTYLYCQKNNLGECKFLEICTISKSFKMFEKIEKFEKTISKMTD